MSLRLMFNNEISIKRPTYTTGEGGRQTVTWATIYRRIKCRFNALANKETIITYDKKTWFANFYIYLEYLSGIKEGDRVYTTDGGEYEIKLVQDWDKAKNYMKLAVAEIGRGE
jgi:SPP1 family predicted phage head-tail adaptor